MIALLRGGGPLPRRADPAYLAAAAFRESCGKLPVLDVLIRSGRGLALLAREHGEPVWASRHRSVRVQRTIIAVVNDVCHLHFDARRASALFVEVRDHVAETTRLDRGIERTVAALDGRLRRLGLTGTRGERILVATVSRLVCLELVHDFIVERVTEAKRSTTGELPVALSLLFSR